MLASLPFADESVQIRIDGWRIYQTSSPRSYRVNVAPEYRAHSRPDRPPATDNDARLGSSERPHRDAPLIPGLRASVAELIGIRLAELAAPFADGFVRHNDPTGEQQLFDIAVAQAETKVQPDT